MWAWIPDVASFMFECRVYTQQIPMRHCPLRLVSTQNQKQASLPKVHVDPDRSLRGRRNYIEGASIIVAVCKPDIPPVGQLNPALKEKSSNEAISILLFACSICSYGHVGPYRHRNPSDVEMIWQTSKVRRGTLQYWSSRGERFWGRRLQLNALMAWRHCPIRYAADACSRHHGLKTLPDKDADVCSLHPRMSTKSRSPLL